jgi:hypothetical protein
MMEAVRTSETSVDNHFTRQYNPEDSSEHPLTSLVHRIRGLSLGLFPLILMFSNVFDILHFHSFNTSKQSVYFPRVRSVFSPS